MANSINYDFRVLDRFSGPIRGIARSMRRMTDAVSEGNQRLSQMGNRLRGVGERMSNVQGALAGVGAVAAITTITKSTMRIQDAISDVGKVSDMTGKQLSGLRKNIEGLSERIGRPAEALAQIAFEGKKLGTTNKDLIPFVETVSKMAIAFEMTEAEAGAAIGSIKTKLGLSMEQVIKMGDSINHLANETTAGGKNMIEIINRTSGAMSSLKIPPDIAAGFAAIGDQLSTSADVGATSIKAMFKVMNKMPGMTKKLMSDPIKAVQEVMKKFVDLPEDQRPTAIIKEFGDEAGTLVMSLVPKMKLFGEVMNKAMSPDKIGSMQREMDDYLKRASTRFKIAQAKMTNAMNRFGESMVPIIEIIANMVGGIGKVIGKFSEAHPTISKIAAGMVVLLAVTTAILVPIGLIAVGIGSMLTAATAILPALVALKAIMLAVNLAFLANPITWIVAGIVLAVAAVYRLITAWDELKAAWSEGGIFKAAATFFGFGGEDEEGIKKVSKTTGITNIENIKNVSNTQDILSTFGVTNVEKSSKSAATSAIKTRATEQNVNVGGTIRVAADPGAKVTNLTPDLNAGPNMEWALF